MEGMNEIRKKGKELEMKQGGVRKRKREYERVRTVVKRGWTQREEGKNEE